LIQKGVNFKNLGLAIIDEQHRFGVDQRRRLKEQSGDADTMPHLLSMSATPIPRTLALALYGELDLSIIDEMPAGRLAVMTRVVPPRKRADAYEFVKEHLKQGEQCFILCPLIDPSDTLGVKSVTAEYDQLSKGPLAGQSLAMLHGKMAPREKDAIMEQMRAKKIDVLVATSVIEVGVDIPDATIIMIEGAERFGLAQLHQFRGRVGRSDRQSYCFLFTDSPSESTTERLSALVSSNDGMKLAEKDLDMRGSGEVLGTEQSGYSEVAMLAVQQPALLAAAQAAARLSIADNWLQKSAPLQAKMNAFLQSVHLE
ncbi:MAG: DNA helicase RecG, partial [Candidatus Kerfeldbacteria bacterium CG_4_9_14_3_um_filter_45_8]